MAAKSTEAGSPSPPSPDSRDAPWGRPLWWLLGFLRLPSSLTTPLLRGKSYSPVSGRLQGCFVCEFVPNHPQPGVCRPLGRGPLHFALAFMIRLFLPPSPSPLLLLSCCYCYYSYYRCCCSYHNSTTSLNRIISTYEKAAGRHTGSMGGRRRWGREDGDEADPAEFNGPHPSGPVPSNSSGGH